MERHRIATWWMRWEDLNWPNQDNLDRIKARADGFAKADVTAAMFFGAHFRWDFLPVFPLLHDYIATVADELHKRGVKLFDHHSVDLVHRYSTREEMRHVMLDSGPHLPFSPTYEAAASWEYKGKRLNDWRMLDVRTQKPLYLGQYTAECFCFQNAEYREAYQDYIRYLIAETNIDGLSADDALHFMGYNSCSCPHCRAEFKRRTGLELPSVEDRTFWGNWDNPAWLEWIDQRFDASGLFYRELAAVLPEGFMLTACGPASANAAEASRGADARKQLEGCNYVNMELCGNTPPYKHDPLTWNTPVPHRLVNASHHQAAAREKGVAAFNTGFAHSEVSANHVWAISKVLDGDAWIGTLKARLGLPDHILQTLPCEEDIVGRAFGFEKNHPELFCGSSVGQLGVYFSYETRNHTLMGNLNKGYSLDYQSLLTRLFEEGLSPHTVFRFPADASVYPVVVLSSAARMTECEQADMNAYLAAGGKVIVTGPSGLPGCQNSWKLQNALGAEHDLFTTVAGGVHLMRPEWLRSMELPPCTDPAEWQQPAEGLYYHPHRTSEAGTMDAVIALCRRFVRPMPLQVASAKGYLSTLFETDDQYIVHFLAADYDVRINEELDKIRYHRSRVNLITHAEPVGVDCLVQVRTYLPATVYTPFCDAPSDVQQADGLCTIRLPEKCSYAIITFAR